MEELDLKELFSNFWSKKLEMILIVLIFIAVGVIYSYFLVIPEYKSSTTLVLAQSSTSTDQNSEAGITQTDITLNSKLVSTYSELIKRKAVLKQVVDNLNISEITEETIKDNISIKAVNNTELIEITVTNQNPKYAKLIATEITEVFRQKVEEIYKISNIYLLDEAQESELPSNINHIKDIIVFIFIGIIVAVVYVLLVNMLDNTIKTEQDIEKTTVLIVLASIPDCNVESNKRKGGRR